MGQLLGPHFLQFLLLALAGALVVGNVLALVRPPAGKADDPGRSSPERPPLGRSTVMIGLGLVVVIWTVATLVT